MPIPVIVLNWNGYEDTVECLEAMLEQSYQDFSIILIDNGSDGDEFNRLSARFHSTPQVRLYHNETNLGFTGGMNQALHALLARSDAEPFVVLLNNDAIPESGWLEALLTTARREQADVVASRMVNYFQRDRLDNAGHEFLNTSEVLPRGTGEPPQAYGQPCEVVGACAGAALYRTELFRKIGVFDRFFNTGYEDAEFGLRALVAGYRQVYAPEAVVFHKISRSIDKVRDLDYAVKLQTNINYSYAKLMPWIVVVINAPFIVIKLVGVFCTAALFKRSRLILVQWRALRETVRQRRRIVASRRSVAHLRRRSALRVLRGQRFFLGTYWRYFHRYLLAKKPTVFER